LARGGGTGEELLSLRLRHHDAQYKDTQYNDTQHNKTIM